MNLNYAIFRGEPIMTINDLAQIWTHNKREKKAYNSNTDIDIKRSKDNIELVPFGLASYDKILELKNIDYVGTRLHAGISALSKCHRTIIISIDNRARNIGKDTGLPIVEREDIETLLQQKIYSEFVTDLRIPIDNIKQWKNQFQ